MTILDAQLQLSAAQAVTASAVSTNTIDLGTSRDIGTGTKLFAVVGVDTTAMPEEKKVEWILNYCRAMNQEIAELTDSVPWKWWAKYQTFDRQNARVEVVDLFHFLIFKVGYWLLAISDWLLAFGDWLLALALASSPLAALLSPLASRLSPLIPRPYSFTHFPSSTTSPFHTIRQG